MSLDNILDALAPLALLALTAFFIGGIGWLIHYDQQTTNEFRMQCIADGKQFVERNCVK